MNRLDFLSSLSFLSPCDVAAENDKALILRGVLLSMEAYGQPRRTPVNNDDDDDDVPTTPNRKEDDDKDGPPTLLGPIYFTTSSRNDDTQEDPALTRVNVSMMEGTPPRLVLSVLPASSTDKETSFYHPHHDKEDGDDDDNQDLHYRVLQPPLQTKYHASTNDADDNDGRPACLLLYFDTCALRFFNLDSNNKNDSLFQQWQSRLQAWQQAPMRVVGQHQYYHYAAAGVGGASDSTTPSTSPPAAQTLDDGTGTHRGEKNDNNNGDDNDDKSPRRRLRQRNTKRARTDAYQETCTHLRSIRALLHAPITTNTGGATTTEPVMASLRQFRVPASALYCDDESNRQSLASHMAQLQADSLHVQQALRQALDAYFPVQRRPRRGRNVMSSKSTTISTTSSSNDAPPDQDEMQAHISTLLKQHERLARDRHALGISAMPRW